MRGLVVGCISLLIAVSNVSAATFVSRATGSWNVTGTWATLRTGTITTTSGSTAVTGSGTLFTTELANGNQLFTVDGVLIGTVAPRASNTSLTLTGGAASSNSGIAYYATAGATPVAADSVTINAHNVSLNGANRSAADLTIDAGGTLTTGSNSITIAAGSGVLVINGTIVGNGNAASQVIKSSTGDLSGTGTITNVLIVSVGANTTIAAGSSLTFAGNNCRLDVAASVTLTNNGTLTFSSAACSVTKVINLSTPTTFSNAGTVLTGSIVGTNAATSVWTNAANSTLEVSAVLLTLGTLNASANGNTVRYNVNAAQAVKLPSGGNYFNLVATGGNTKTFAAGTYNVGGDVTINTVTTLNANTSDPIVNVTGNMTITGTYTASSLATSPLTITGDLTIGGTFTAGASPIVLKGDFTRTGTFTTSTGVFTFQGASPTPVAQTFSGSTTINFVTVDNTAGVVLGTGVASNLTLGAAGTLTLTNGAITTNNNTVIVPRACNAAAPVAVSRGNGWVNGDLRKAIPAGASTCLFEVGDAANYSPAVLVFAAGTGAGNLTASATINDHPQLASSGINPNDSVNRYWTLTNVSVTLPAAGYTARFNFVNGSPVDADNLGSVANYTVEQWTGTTWLPTTVAASCAAVDGSHLCEQINTETAFGDFVIGNPVVGFNPIPGSFNAFETTASTTQILGRIFTKLAGTSFTLSIVAVNTTNFVRNAAPATNQLTVEVINSTGTPGAFNVATNCWSGWTSVQSQTVTAPVGWTSGRVNVTINAPTQAVRDARIRVTQAITGLIGCSTDRFSVRPAAFTISSTANNSTTGSGTTVKTGVFFSMTAQPVTTGAANITVGYTRTPSFDFNQVIGSPNAGTLASTIGGFSAATGGAATGANFYYSEVGTFGLNANAIADTAFALDQADDCNAGSFSNTVDGAGKFGCSIGQAAIPVASGFGRFIPDNFAVSFNTPMFNPACTGFSYVGQSFGYATPPVLTVTARNGTTNGLANATATNYAGAYMKITNTTVTPATQAARFSRNDALGLGSTPPLDTSGMPATAGDPQIRYNGDGIVSPAPPAAGLVVLNFSSSGTLFFQRDATTPKGPFDADIALAVNVIDSDGVAFATNPASFGAATPANGITFTGGNKTVRYGVIRLLDVFAPLAGNSSGFAPVSIQAQYWTGTVLALNTLDSCTSLTEKNFVLYGHAGSITAANLPTPTAISNGKVSMGVATLSAGTGRVNVVSTSSPPAPITTITQPGSVKICLDLDASPGSQIDNTCVAVTPANKAYLQGRWVGTSYDKDPNATVGFGLYGAQPKNFIYFRENY